MAQKHHELDGYSRRTFIMNCARAAFGLSVVSTIPTELLAATPAALGNVVGNKNGFGKAKRIIFIHLKGGLSHIDTFDPKTGASKGPAKMIKTTGDFQATDYVPKIATIAKHLCVIRSMTAKIGVHQPAQYYMRTGYAQRGTVRHPNLGAWAQHYLGPSHETMPSSAALCRGSDQGNGFFPVLYAPLAITDPTSGLQHAKASVNDNLYSNRLTLLDQLDMDFRKRVGDSNVNAYTDFYNGAIKLMKSKELNAFDVAAEPQAMHDAYGKGNLGQSCLLARRLISSGTRFVEIDHGDWDFHQGLVDGFEEKGPELDQAFSALITDLQQSGLLESTLVVLATEFGRKPNFSGDGRGHHPLCFSTILAGAGIKGGYAYGASDALGEKPATKPTSIGDFHATIGWAAGLQIEKETIAPNGRPFTVGDNGKVIKEVFA